MGNIINEKFAKVHKYVFNLSATDYVDLLDLIEYCDDDTWEAFDYERNRRNYIGAHIFMSRGSLAEELDKDRSNLKKTFKSWESSGWLIRADKVKALQDDRTYKQFISGWKGTPPIHYVFNVSMLCRLLDVRETAKKYKIRLKENDDFKALVWFALTSHPDDFNNPPIDSFINGYKPRAIIEWQSVSRNGAPDTWEDLYEAKKESAGEGAGAKVETDLERAAHLSNELSTIDVITSADEFAKVSDELFPFTVSIIQDEGDLIIDFLPEHINEQGRLDIDRVGVTDEIKEEFYDPNVGPSGRVERFNESHNNILLAMRRYLDEQRE